MTTCLACGAPDCRDILNFGPQPAANLLPDEPDAPVKRVPLTLVFCDACGHAQQGHFYPPGELFGHYLYRSGTTKTLATYFDWLADAIARMTAPGGRVLELASNDGSFLASLRDSGLSATGVEPARNLVALSRERGFDVIEGYWPAVRLGQKFERIVAMNVLAHGPDPLSFLAGIGQALTPRGIAFVQVSQADMFRNFEFDTLYHEHYSFFCPSSLNALARKAGLPASRFCKARIHGGSIIALLGFDDSPLDEALAALAEGDFVEERLEAVARPSSAEADAFEQRAMSTCSSLAALTRLAREAGRRTVLVGAAAKAITVLQASKVAFDYVIDEAPLKIGRYIPGTGTRIRAFADIATVAEPCLFVIGAWNFRAEIEGKLRALRQQDDLTAVYFPAMVVGDLQQR